MQIVTSRGGDPAYQTMLDDLIREVFGFSFAPWFARGLWDERYESHAIVEDGRMLANISLFKSDLVVAGKPVRAHQFGGVATRKEARGKGLSRRLMEHVGNLYPETPAYLAAHPGVADFYPRFGFLKVGTYRPEMALRIEKAFGVSMDTLMRKQNSYDIAQTRARADEIKVERYTGMNTKGRA